MSYIQELRERLQGPRQKNDTLLGKLVMRPLSIYVTAALIRVRATPMMATLASILLGLWGCWLLAQKEWVAGILLVNVWYLLDHVDGELARFYNIVSPTGLYFDTIANAFIQPATFAALGYALSNDLSEAAWFYTGLWAAYGLLMLSIIPFCESNVILQWLQTRAPAPCLPGKTAGAADSAKKGLGKTVFEALHSSVAFPSILLVMTPVMLVCVAASSGMEISLRFLLAAYALITTFIWATALTHQILTKKIDAKYNRLKDELFAS